MTLSSQVNPMNSIEVRCILDTLKAMIHKEHMYSFNLDKTDDCEYYASSSASKSIPSTMNLDGHPYSKSPCTVIPDKDSGLANDGSQEDHHRSKIVLTESVYQEVCQWMYRVVDHYGFDRKIVGIAMNIFVRFVSRSSGRYDDAKGLELPTATSLYLAMKLHRQKRSRSDNLLDDFVSMSSSRFTSNDILQMESEMLRTLTWLVNPIMPQDYIPLIIRFLSYYDEDIEDSTQHSLIDTSKYLSELILFYPHLASINSVTLAFAATTIALRGLNSAGQDANHDKLCDHLYLFYFYGLIKDMDALSDIITEITLHLNNISPSNQKDNGQVQVNDPADSYINYVIMG